MSFRDRLGIFVLTKEEQRAIAFVILMLALGLLTKHYRATHPPTNPPNEQVEAHTPG
ncbi:MAG TPA: hypothetical protein VGI85_15080 [Chthoniobacterales bacterium]|jgi:hypothetical protein